MSVGISNEDEVYVKLPVNPQVDRYNDTTFQGVLVDTGCSREITGVIRK